MCRGIICDGHVENGHFDHVRQGFASGNMFFFSERAWKTYRKKSGFIESWDISLETKRISFNLNHTF